MESHKGLRWRAALLRPSRLYEADLAYRVEPLMPLATSLVYLSHTRLKRAAPLSASGSANSPTGDARHTSLGVPFTYSEAYTCSLAIGHELGGHEGCINSLATNTTGEFLLSGSDDLRLCLYDTCDWSLRQRYRTMHRANIFHAVFVPGNEGRVLSCALDGRTILTDLETSQPYYKSRFLSMASSVATSPWWPDMAYIAYSNGLINRVDTRACSSENEPPAVGNPCLREVTQVNVLGVHERWPFLIVSGTNTSKVYLHDVRMGFLGAYAALSIPNVTSSDGIGGLQFSERGDVMAVNFRCQDAYAVPWLDTMHSTRMPESYEAELAKSDSIEVLLGMGSGNIPCVPVHNAVQLRGRRNVQTMFKEVAFMDDDNIICTGGDCGNVFFWRREDGKLLHVTRGDSDIVNVVHYNRRVGNLVTSGIDATAKVMEAGRHIRASPSPPQTTRRLPIFRNAGVEDPGVALLSALVRDTIQPASGTVSNSVAGSHAWEGSDEMDAFDEASEDEEGSEEETQEWPEQRRNRSRLPRRLMYAHERCVISHITVTKALDEHTSLQQLVEAVRMMKAVSEMANRIVSGGSEVEDFSVFSSVPFLILATSRLAGWDVRTSSEEYSSAERLTSDQESEDDNNGRDFNDPPAFFVLEESDFEQEINSALETGIANAEVEERSGPELREDNEENENEDAEGAAVVRFLHHDGGDAPPETETVALDPSSHAQLFATLCFVLDKLKRNLYFAFRQWTIPNVGKAQVARWDRCTWGVAAKVPTPLGDEWLTQAAADYNGTRHFTLNRRNRNDSNNEDADAGHRPDAVTADEEASSRRLRVKCILYVMDLLLQGKEFLCSTTEDRRRYWLFRSVLELCYVYYFMAVGDTEAAIDRVTRLERHAEYRCITALGTVNRAYLRRMQQQQQRRRNGGEAPRMMIEVPRALDFSAFTPLLVPLALHIRILVLSRNEAMRAVTETAGLLSEEGEQQPQQQQQEEKGYDRRVSLLVEEMRRRLDGHPNRKVSNKVVRMLRGIQVNV
ncbi:hypothetical protein DQ04_02301020 [Trypanosoma grayi]|uniref:hypothetical protein n=1 Tax=Trypanosoma grayi TaxID=71804 RepID=UPI0004F49BC7|nr:hypothetical protein DQ04_02301020 [Trypanosoma grayi]KEG11763.1 hypothetical protein DQ04_02301020 [Trypanosoma grayi]